MEVTEWLISKCERLNNLQGAAGGFDKLLLDSLYDDAIQRRFKAAAQRISPAGTSGHASNPFDDIFTNNYVPPSPGSMHVMQQQAFLVQQQQRLSSSMPSADNPFGNPFGVPSLNPSLSPPPQLTLQPPPTTNQFRNNPFGNPGLLWFLEDFPTARSKTLRKFISRKECTMI